MAEASEEGLGSKWAVVPIMMMISCIFYKTLKNVFFAMKKLLTKY
jgi:hypothetical protein